jgi:hypothetical protein
MKIKIIIAILLLFIVFYNEKHKIIHQSLKVKPKVIPIVEPVLKGPDINDYTLAYQSYAEIIDMVKNWEKSSPLLVETGTYGSSEKGQDNFYFKISNEKKQPQYKAMITACIHGNEPWSTSTIIAYSGYILSQYGKDDRITKILDNTEVYFVPVISPDTYPFARMVNGLDPNRQFPSPKNPDKKSVNPVQNIRDLFLKIKPNSILSGHTYGRVYLVPWGDSRSPNPNEKDYETIVGNMAKLSNYRWEKASQLYGSLIVGSDCDWYHRNGAFSIVMEFGTHQRKPSENDTEIEFDRTKDGFLSFLEESVKVNIISNNTEYIEYYCEPYKIVRCKKYGRLIYRY